MQPHEPISVLRTPPREHPPRRLRLSGTQILRLSSTIAALSTAALIVRIAAEIASV